MPIHYVARQGDCISSIAFVYGFFPDTLWDAPENAGLRQLRGSPHILAPGDVVFVPDKRRKNIAAATDQKHRYVRKGVPERLRLQLFYGEQPRASEPFALEIDGVIVLRDQTTADGRIEVAIPPNAQRGRILLHDGAEVFALELGYLLPIDETEGVQMRLQNLGYYPGPLNGSISDDLAEALVWFQADQNLEPTGEADDPTKAALQKACGG